MASVVSPIVDFYFKQFCTRKLLFRFRPKSDEQLASTKLYFHAVATPLELAALASRNEGAGNEFPAGEFEGQSPSILDPNPR